MKKQTKHLLALVLSTMFVGAGAGSVVAYNATNEPVVASAAIADMVKVDTAISCVMPLEEGKVKNLTSWGYYDSNGDGAADVWAFSGNGTATAQPEIRFSTPGTDTTPGSSSRVYAPKAFTSISVEYNITNSGTELAESSTTQYLLQILGATEGTGSPNQYYYHIPEIIADGAWHTLTIDLSSEFSGGSNESLPMNVTSFDDINDIVCCWNFKMGKDFNGEVMLRNFTAVEEVAVLPTHNLSEAVQVSSWGDQGDYTEALLYRFRTPSYTAAQWPASAANDSLPVSILQAIKVNGKSIYDHNQEYKALIAAGEKSPITWTGMPENSGAPAGSGRYMQPNLADDVNNGTTRFAPIFVSLTNHGGSYGSTIDLYIPKSYLPREDITSIEFAADFAYESNGNVFTYGEGVSFLSNSLGIPRKVVGKVETPSFNVIETQVKKIDGTNSQEPPKFDSFLRFYLTNSDYDGLNTVSFAAIDASFLQRINFYDHILIDGVKFGAYWRNNHTAVHTDGDPINPGEQFFNVWGKANSFGLRWPSMLNSLEAAYGVQEITILAGCQFPSYKATGSTIYQVMEDTTFYRAADGLFYSEDFTITKDQVKIGEGVVAGEKGELVQIDFSYAGWNSTRDSYDYNYFGEQFVAMRKNIFINGKSLWEINTTTDDTGYEYTGQMANETVKEGYHLFHNPTLLRASGDTVSVYVHKQYLANAGINEMTITIKAGFIHSELADYIVSEDISAKVWTKPINVTVDGKAVGNYVYGDEMMKPDIPAAPVEAGYNYTFAGWTVDGKEAVFPMTLTEDVAITSSWTKTAIEYTATMVYANGETENITYTIENRAEMLKKLQSKLTANSAEYEYKNDLPGELPLNNGEYKEVKQAVEYTITFANVTGVNAIKFTVENKNEVKFPAVPAKEGYTAKWDKGEADVKLENTTVTAVYTAINYTVTFAGCEGVDAITFTVETMATVEFPAVPEKAGYTAKWDKAASELTLADVTVNAVYEIVNYTVTFAGCEGVDAITFTVETMATVEFPAVPEKAGYTAAWDKTAADVTLADITVNAVYEAIEYTATVVMADGTSVEVKFTVENAAEKLAEIAAMLPANTEDYTYAWAETMPEELALADVTFTVVATEVEDEQPEPEQPGTGEDPSDEPEAPAAGGCGSSIVGIGAAVTLLGAAVVVTMKKKED